MKKFSKDPKETNENYEDIKKPLARPPKKDDEDKDKARHITRKEPKKRTLGFEKGGKVKSTGEAKLHKGEVVLPKELVKRFMKLMK